MSDQLNKDIRDFFVKIGTDIKKAFDECSVCCCCCCPNKRVQIYAQTVGDIENQITKDMNRANTNNNIDKATNTINIENKKYVLERNIIIEVNEENSEDSEDFDVSSN